MPRRTPSRAALDRFQSVAGSTNPRRRRPRQRARVQRDREAIGIDRLVALLGYERRR